MVRFFVALTAALALAPAAFAWGTDVRINETASWLAQRQVSIRCLTPREEYRENVGGGYTPGKPQGRNGWRFGNYAMLSPGFCDALQSLVRDTGVNWPESTQAVAMMTLVHESGHLRNARWSADEAKTQRWALRHYVAGALAFGVDEAKARSLLRHAVRFHLGLPRSYRIPGCRRPYVDDAGRLRACQ